MPNEACRIRNLERLLDVARRMAATTDLSKLLGTIIDAARDVLGCERATIFLYDAGRRELYSLVATGAETIRFPADRGIAGAAAQQRCVVNVSDAYADSRFNQEIDRQTGFRTRNLLTFPLENLSGDLMGVLQALNKTAGPFTADDEELARVLSAQAGVALDRWRLQLEYAEKRRMARDLELARVIQLAYLPKSDPRIDGYDVAGWNRSADETGGDCYDFMPLADGRTAILLADATGHGIGAALVIAQWRSAVRALLSTTGDVAATATRVNALLSGDLSDDRFVTAFVGVLDPRRNRIEFVAGGQGPLLFVDGDHVDWRPADGIPFAVLGDTEYDVQTYEFRPGALLALLTDGFYEATSVADEQFGDDRVVALLREHRRSACVALIERLHAAVLEFRGERPQADDLTAVLIRRSP